MLLLTQIIAAAAAAAPAAQPVATFSASFPYVPNVHAIAEACLQMDLPPMERPLSPPLLLPQQQRQRQQATAAASLLDGACPAERCASPPAAALASVAADAAADVTVSSAAVPPGSGGGQLVDLDPIAAGWSAEVAAHMAVRGATLQRQLEQWDARQDALLAAGQSDGAV
jgi:hypothetical protein